jgi:imidazole glycerol-phosphate synthase subunit HisH
VIVALIDYKAGNLTSVRKALTSLGADILTPVLPVDVERAGAIIVPGVGHFAATAALDDQWHGVIRSRLEAGIPLLGICLGQQWLFEGSEEAPDVRGLGVLPGRCMRLDLRKGADGSGSESRGHRLKVPHVGWNALKQTGRPSRLLAGIADEAQAYFTHSYVAPDSAATVATTDHGVSFASVVEDGLVFGAQFHPEKSGDTGLRMLRNFLDVAAEGWARRTGPAAATEALPPPDSGLASTDGRLPTRDSRLPMPDSRLPIADSPLPEMW